MKKLQKKNKKLENPEFAKAVGKSTLLRIDWKDWKKELPPTGVPIWIVIRLSDGYYPVTATYIDEHIPASKDGECAASRWQRIMFDEYLPDIFIGNTKDKNAKRLIAWGRNKGIIQLGTDCHVCKRLDCACKKS